MSVDPDQKKQIMVYNLPLIQQYFRPWTGREMDLFKF